MTPLYAVTAAGLFAAALLVSRILPLRAAVRHFVLVSAFVAVVLLPFASALLRRAPIVHQMVSITVTADQASAPAAPARRFVPAQWLPGLASIWLAGAAIAALRLLRSVPRRRVVPSPSQSLSDAIAASLGIRRHVRLRESESALVPDTWGVFRPVVTLPAGACTWPSERLHVVLTHELMHVRRNDWLAGVIAEAGAALHWFNPLAWFAVRELHVQRELACDDAVLAHGIDGCDYAGHLLEVAAAFGSSTPSASVAMAEVSHLETRIRSILDGTVKHGGINMFSKSVVATLAAAALFATAGFQAAAQGGSAALSGTVMDPSSSRIPQASVIVANTETGKKEIIRTNETGEFSFASLPAGVYNLEVAMRGFQLFRQEKLTLAPGSAQNVSVVLALGRLTETINVSDQRTAPKPAPTGTGTPQRIRVGGNVQAAKVVKMVRPAYPPSAKAAGIEGTVLLEAVIGRDGRIVNLKSVNTLVHADLLQAAMEAVNQWQYEPTYLNGNPVEILTAITVNFTLAD